MRNFVEILLRSIFFSELKAKNCKIFTIRLHHYAKQYSYFCNLWDIQRSVIYFVGLQKMRFSSIWPQNINKITCKDTEFCTYSLFFKQHFYFLCVHFLPISVFPCNCICRISSVPPVSSNIPLSSDISNIS